MKHFSIKYFSISILLLGIVNLSARTLDDNVDYSDKKGFIQNIGQIHDQFGNPRPDVLFVYEGESYKAVLRDNGFSYEWYSKKNADDSLDNSFTSQRLDINFCNSAKNILAEGINARGTRTNFFLNSQKQAGAKTFESVRYSSVYPGIDFEFHIENGALKYDIIAHPGSHPEQIQLEYSGCESLSVIENTLSIKTSLGTIVENIPSSFLKSEDHYNGKTIEIKLNLSGNKLRFDIPAYDPGLELVIDPTGSLVWGTFFGGARYDNILDVHIGPDQLIYFAGWTNSLSNVATSGAYQTTLIGSTDILLGKFDNTGQLIWATYFGGNDQERVNSFKLDSAGNIYMTGFTKSTSGFASPGAYQTVYGGGAYDSYIAVFDFSGMLSWCSYVGGNDDDNGLGLDVSATGSVYIAGETQSTSGLSSAGAFQSTYGGGSYDGFFAHFLPSGQMQWISYLGGTNLDRLKSVAINNSGQLLVAGGSYSSGMSTAGTYQATIHQLEDAYVAVFDTSCVRQWASYFGGNGGDEIHCCLFNNQNEIICGGLTSSLTYIATAGAFKTYLEGSSDGFLLKLNNTGSLCSWATYWGGNQNDGIDNICLDSNSVIYLLGSTNSSSGLASPGAYQPAGNNLSVTDYDVCVAAFTDAGQRLWSTFFGYNEDDFGHGIAVDTTGNVYFGGYTASQSYFATPGTYQYTPGSNNTYYDGFLEKFDQPVILTGTIANPFCAGSVIGVPFTATGNFGPTQTFEALLSDSMGSFSTYTVIGTISGTSSGVINATIPSNTPGSNLYRIAVRSVDRNIFDQDNGSNITIWPIPVVSFVLPFDFCLYAHWTDLDFAIPGGQPSGGYYSGPGVDTADVFTAANAGLGIHNICYTYTDPHNCATQTACWPVLVYAPLSASFSAIPPVCANTPPFALTQGAPTAPGFGIYVGPGIDSLGNFDASSVGTGTYTLSYIYFDIGGCLPDTAYLTITVDSVPQTPVVSWNGYLLNSSLASSYQWYLNGNPVANSNYQTWTPLQNGTYYVVAVYGSCHSAPSNSIVVTNVGIPETGWQCQFDVSPNPNDGHFGYSFVAGKSADYTVTVLDLTGRIILERHYENSFSADDEGDISTAGAGIYLVCFSSGNNRIAIRKLVVR